MQIPVYRAIRDQSDSRTQDGFPFRLEPWATFSRHLRRAEAVGSRSNSVCTSHGRSTTSKTTHAGPLADPLRPATCGISSQSRLQTAGIYSVLSYAAFLVRRRMPAAVWLAEITPGDAAQFTVEGKHRPHESARRVVAVECARGPPSYQFVSDPSGRWNSGIGREPSVTSSASCSGLVSSSTPNPGRRLGQILPFRKS